MEQETPLRPHSNGFLYNQQFCHLLQEILTSSAVLLPQTDELNVPIFALDYSLNAPDAAPLGNLSLRTLSAVTDEHYTNTRLNPKCRGEDMPCAPALPKPDAKRPKGGGSRR